MSWSEYPLLRPALFFILGIILNHYCPVDRYILGILLSVTLASSILIHFKTGFKQHEIKIKSYLILVSMMTTGGLISEQQKIKYDLYHYSHYINDDYKNDTLVFLVLDEITIKNSVKTIAEAKSINGTKVRGKILAYLQKDSLSIDYEPGDLIVIESRIQPTRKNTNPEAFDYKAFLKNRSIEFQTYITSGKHIRINTDQQGRLSYYTYQIRKWSLSKLRAALPDDNHYAIAAAMVLGVKNNISNELYTAYSETGSVHVLAVSGLHVGIVVGIFIWLFKFIRSKKKIIKILKLVVLLVIVWSYTMITGAAPAVTRAALMFSLFLIGKFWFDNYNIYNILAASALILLAYDPLLLFQASFQFSFLALTSIVYFHKLLYTPLIVENRILNYITNLGVVSIAAQILVFPVTIYYFHKFPIYFILSGIVAVTLAGFVLGLGLCTIIFSGVPLLFGIFSFLLDFLLYGFVNSIFFIHQLPFSSINGIWLSTSSMIFIYIALLSIMYMVKFRPDFKSITVVLLMLICIISESIYTKVTHHNKVLLTIYDTSGKSILIDIFDEEHNQVYRSETITDDDIAFVAENHRLKYGVSSIDTLEHQDGITILKDKVIYCPFLDHNKERFPRSSDLLLIIEGYSYPPTYTMKHHKTKEIIVGKSIPYYLRKQWKEYCKENDILFHDIRENGAYLKEY